MKVNECNMVYVMKLRTIISDVLLVLVLLAGVAAGQEVSEDGGDDELFDMSLEELSEIDITSASFFTTTTRKAPGFVMSYDMDEIEMSPVRTLADLFELYVPGAISGSHERQGRLVGTRGLMIDNNAKTLVMWDGQQINFRMHFGYMVGMLSPFLGDVAKVEVIHGPGVVMHGSGAINGLVNMIPKTGTSHPGGFVKYEYGFREKARLYEGGYGFSYGENRDVYIYGGKYLARGFEPEDSLGASQSYAADVEAFGFKRNNFRVSTVWNHENFNLNIFSYSLSPQKNSNTEYGYFMNQSLGVRPKFLYEISETDSVEVSASLLLNDFGNVDSVNSPEDIRGGSERHWNVRSVYKTTAIENHQIAFGGVYGKKTFYDMSYFLSNDPRDGYESIDTEWEEIGIFTEDVITLSDSLTFSAGLRYEVFNVGNVSSDSPNITPDTYGNENTGTISPHFSPRVAFAYEYDKETSVKASYQHGFRMPDAIYYNWNLQNNAAATGLGYANSPSLKPEEMDSYELNLEKILNDKVTVNANMYYNIFKDQLSWGPLTNYWTADQVDAINHWTPAASWTWEGGMFQNIEGKFAVYGSEVMVDYKLSERTDLNLSYGYAKTDDDSLEQRYPAHQVKARIMSEVMKDKLTVGINYVYNSSYKYDSVPSMSSYYEDSRNIIDMSAVYQVTDNFRIKGVAKNVFGELTPPAGFLMSNANRGNMGYSEPRYYLSGEFRF